jgi:thioredoxin
MMKKSWFWLAGVLLLSAMSCQGQSAQSGNKPAADPKSQNTEIAGLMPGASNQAAVHITKADFLKLVMDYEKNTETWDFKGEIPCLIDFYADWCAPCKITSPILEELAAQYAGRINIYKVDIEKEQELAAVFGIQSIPTFLFCPVEGNPTISSGIARTPEDTKNMFIQQIEELLLKGAGSPAI